jgi:hypothetical protein
MNAAQKEKSLSLRVLKPKSLADQTCKLVITLLSWLYCFSLYKTFLCMSQDCI